jgi:hypothetical protein
VYIELDCEKTSFSYLLKGMVSQDFFLPVFFMNQFSPGPLIIPLVIFFSLENSQRYLQLNVHQRCQRHLRKRKKMFVKSKVFPYFVIALWVAVCNI